MLPAECETYNRTSTRTLQRRTITKSNTSSSYLTKQALQCVDRTRTAMFEDRASERTSNYVRNNCVLQSLALRNKLSATAGRVPAGDQTRQSCQRLFVCFPRRVYCTSVCWSAPTVHSYRPCCHQYRIVSYDKMRCLDDD